MPGVKVAIIGAGVSGLPALKECLVAGLDATIFEARDEIGGNWAYDHAPGLSSVYAGATLNSNRDTTAFTDFPLDPAIYGDYLNHRQYMGYLRDYVDHFKLREHIMFNTKVLSCEPLNGDENGESTGHRWKVTIQTDGGGPGEIIFDAVLAATGHSNYPFMPQYPGRELFKGKLMHAHEYRTPGPFEGKRVAVIGFGNSAIDVACEIAPQAKECHMITRRGGRVMPRFVLGKPLEAYNNRATQLWCPKFISQFLQTVLLGIIEPALPAELMPEHKIMETHVTIRGDFHEKANMRLITMHRADVVSLTESGLILTPTFKKSQFDPNSGSTLDDTASSPSNDNSKNAYPLDVDVIIVCTGYDQAHLPYLPSNIIRPPSDSPFTANLYKMMHPPSYPGLFLIGFVELSSPLVPAIEAQARHICGLLTKRIALPSLAAMQKDIAAQQAWQHANLIPTARHTMFLPTMPYIDGLLEPLGAAPTLWRLLWRCLTRNPIRAWRVLSAVWFGIPSSAQWRLVGQGNTGALAEETVLRAHGGERQLRPTEKGVVERAKKTA